MASIRIEGREHLPAQPAFFVLNRMPCIELLRELERQLGGAERVAWLVVDACMPGSEIMEALRAGHAKGIFGSLQRHSGIMLAEQIHDTLGRGCSVVLLPGPREHAGGAALSDVPGRVLTYMDGCSLSAVPVYVGMYNGGMHDAATAHTPCSEIRLRVLPGIGRVMQGARVLEAWMECAADMFAELPEPGETSLARMLLASLKEHPDSKLIDGVDDTELPYPHLLAISLMLARALRRSITNKRLGIILPPGKRSIIANLACIFAGITPVNINYAADKDTIREMMVKACVTWSITESRFKKLRRDFPWEEHASGLIDIDEKLEELGGGRMYVWRQLVRRAKAEHLLRFLDLPRKKPQDETALVFSGGTAGAPKAIALTQQMTLANLRSLQSRMQLQPGQSVLCAAPLHTCAGFIPGLLMPLLYGCNMVTYPSTQDAGARLRELMLQHDVVSAIGTPDLARELVADGKEVPLLSLKYLVAAGGVVPPALARAVAAQLHTPLVNAYTLSETACLVTLCPGDAAAEEPAGPAKAQPHAAGSAEPLPGIAVSISDPRHPNRLLPVNTPGLLWVRGAALTRGYEDDDEATIANIRNGWLRTGDLALVDAEGRLHVLGTKERYSLVRGEFIPHVMLEHILMEGLDAPADAGRTLAVVSFTDRDARDHLIMLTTLPQEALPANVMALRYALRNEGYSENWCPEIILPVAKIPELPNGRLDYGAARQLAKQWLDAQE